MIKLLTFDDLFPPLRLLKLLVELRRLSRFATKMTLVHGSWAVLSIEKISYSKSSSSQNLKLSIIDTSLYAGTIVPRLSDQKDWVDFRQWSVIFTLQWASVYIFLSPQTINYFTFYRVTIICGAPFDTKSMVFFNFLLYSGMYGHVTLSTTILLKGKTCLHIYWIPKLMVQF